MTPAIRLSIYRLLWIVTVAAMTARVCSTERTYDPTIFSPAPGQIEDNAPTRAWPATRPWPMPTFGSNDRSRWATIRAIVEDGTFVIGYREILIDGKYRDFGRVFSPGYESVDKVLDPKSNNFYSSKPPLLTVMLAGEYWLLTKFGLNLDDDRWLVVRLIVWTANVLPLALMLWLFAKVLERHGQSDWGRLFTFVTACFGTFLTTFAITLNNHIPAAVATFLACYPVLMRGMSRIDNTIQCGLFAGLATCFELPAASLLAALVAYLVVRRLSRSAPPSTELPNSDTMGNSNAALDPAPKTRPLVFLLAALIPIAAQFGLTYLAIGTPIPAYAKLSQSGSENWYDYPGSHWHREPGESKHGIDWARDYESRISYAFHMLIGHHGLFSLSPVWILAFVAMLFVAGKNPRIFADRSRVLDHVLVLTLFVSLIVTVFYIRFSPALNYGGWTSGLRWFFWLTPLWLLGVLRGADYIDNTSSRLARFVALSFLAISVFSTCYRPWNAWRHPWLYDLLEAYGLIPYGK